MLDVGSDRLSQFVASERRAECRTWETPVSPKETVVHYSPKAPKETVIYYSPKSLPQASPKRESFDERYARNQAAKGTLPTSPILVPRKRQDSSLSLASQESFPSLSSVPSAPATPLQKVMGWSDAVRKNLDSMPLSALQKSQMRLETEAEDWEEEVIECDEDGFPHVRYR